MDIICQNLFKSHRKYTSYFDDFEERLGVPKEVDFIKKEEMTL